MSIFKPVNEKDAKGKVKKVFDDIKHTRNINTKATFGGARRGHASSAP